MNSKDKMIELLCNKLRKRILELDRDAARLSLVNKVGSAETIRKAIAMLQLTVIDLEG